MEEKEELTFVTEVGSFGGLNMKNPTSKKVGGKEYSEEEIQAILKENVTRLKK